MIWLGAPYSLMKVSSISNGLTDGECILCLCIDYISPRPRLPCLITPLIKKERYPATIHGYGIIHWFYVGKGQVCFVIFNYTVGNFIPDIFFRYNPEAALILGARNFMQYTFWDPVYYYDSRQVCFVIFNYTVGNFIPDIFFRYNPEAALILGARNFMQYATVSTN